MQANISDIGDPKLLERTTRQPLGKGRREEIYANDHRDLEHLRTNIGAFIDQHYNRCRLHSALGYRSPEEFEQAVAATTVAAGVNHEFF